eukprot:scaffold1012_cov124-Isochrysis_galbana.AAC.5
MAGSARIGLGDLMTEEPARMLRWSPNIGSSTWGLTAGRGASSAERRGRARCAVLWLAVRSATALRRAASRGLWKCGGGVPYARAGKQDSSAAARVDWWYTIRREGG